MRKQQMSTKSPKILGRNDLVLFTVSAIVLLDTLAATASIGPSSLFWWAFLGVVFMIPIGLISAELGTTYPAEGGIYVWVRKAFGQHWAARVVWAYWINMAIWLPAIYILFAGVLSQLFELSLTLQAQIAIGIALAWLTASLDVAGLRIGKWVPNLGASFKFIIFGVLIFLGYRYGLKNGFANQITVQSLSPQWKEGLKYLPVIIYGMLGFELVSGAGGEIKRPGRDVPIAILISGIVVFCLYFFSTFGILSAIPTSELDIVEGLVDTLRLLFADIPGGDVIVTVLGMMTLFTFFSNGATWAIGANRTVAEAATEGQLPSIFSIRSKRHGGPVGAAIVMGVVCTIALLLYGRLATTNEDLFWALFSFSAVIFMLPYVALALAFVRLRRTDTKTARPFKVPGGDLMATALSAICVVIHVSTIGLFLYVPEGGWQWSTIFGVSFVLLTGELLIKVGMIERK